MDFSKDSVVVKTLENALKTNKLSHAYLVVSEDSLYCDEFIIQFVKSIFCLENDEKNFTSCEQCKNCQSINHNNYVDFYKITSESSIKKEDVQLLKSELMVKAFYGKKIYWIKDVEKMTEQAANSLLKFLEEPEDDIIAILSCKNISAVLPTIISRCQQIKLVGKKSDISEEVNEEISKFSIEFLNRFSRKKHLAAVYLLEKLKVKEDIVTYFTQLNTKVLNSYTLAESSEEVRNISNVQEKVLLALEDLKSNVAATLVLEKFLFTVILDNNSLEFLKRG